MHDARRCADHGHRRHRARARRCKPRRRARRTRRSTRPNSARATATRDASSKRNCARDEADARDHAEGIQQRRAGAPGQTNATSREYLDRVADMKAAIGAQGKRHRGPQARTRQAAAVNAEGCDAVGGDAAAPDAQRGLCRARPSGDDGRRRRSRRPLPVRQCRLRERARLVAPQRAARRAVRLVRRYRARSATPWPPSRATTTPPAASTACCAAPGTASRCRCT